MATQETAPIGAPCWIELTTPETGRACDFYAELFGWTTADQPQLSSENHFRRDGRPIAGYRNRSSGTSADGTWTVYLKCDDAAETVRSAVQNGGRVAIPATEVGDFGVLAQTIDPGGALVGAWQPGKHPGLAVSGEPGSPTWFELQTVITTASSPSTARHSAGTPRPSATPQNSGSRQPVSATNDLPASWMPADTCHPRTRLTGRSTSPPPISTPPCPTSPRWVDHSSARPTTRHSADWPRFRTQPAPSSSSSARTDQLRCGAGSKNNIRPASSDDSN